MPCLQSHTLFAGPLVRVIDWRCRESEPGCSGEEYASGHQIVFTRAGRFMRHDGRRHVLAEPSTVLLFNRHEPYRISHPGGIGDDGTVIVFEQVEQPFQATHAFIEPAALLRLQRLRSQLRSVMASPLEVEEVALRQLDAVTARTHPDATARRRWLDIVEATRLLLVSQLGARTSLSALATAVGCSPFHLTRVFRAVVGVPVYQYLLQMRLAASLERLLDHNRRKGSLSALALDLGFSSHSHFTTLFRRTFGLPPSAFQRLTSAPSVARAFALADSRSARSRWTSPTTTGMRLA